MALPEDFFIFWMREYILKQEAVVAQTPKWNFKANTAGNAIFEGH